MKHSIILLVIAAMPWSESKAQDTEPRTCCFKLGVVLSPEVAYRSLTLRDDNSTTRMIMDLRNEREEPRFAYAGAVYAAYYPSKRWGVEMGIGYSLKGYRFSSSDLVFTDFNDPEGGTGTANDPTIPQSVTYVDNFHYLDLPMRAVVFMGRGRLRSISGLGVTNSFLLRSSTTTHLEYTDGSSDRQTSNSGYDYNTFALFPMASAGIAYALNDGMELRFEPTVRYGVSRMIDAPITGHLWSAGIGVGFTMCL